MWLVWECGPRCMWESGQEVGDGVETYRSCLDLHFSLISSACMFVKMRKKPS